MRKRIPNDEARGLMNTFTADVGLTDIRKAFGDGNCALYAIRGVYRCSMKAVREDRSLLADAVRALAGTALYTMSDNYCNEAAPLGPGILEAVAVALLLGAWITAVGLHAYAVAYGIPIVVIAKRINTAAPRGTWSRHFCTTIYDPTCALPETIYGTDSEARARAFFAENPKCKVLFKTNRICLPPIIAVSLRVTMHSRAAMTASTRPRLALFATGAGLLHAPGA